MLSNVIVNEVAAAGLGLSKAVNLWAEQGQGDKPVVILTGAAGDMEVPTRDGSLQVLVKGYSYSEGYRLSEKILAVIRSLLGVYTFETETYIIKSVVVSTYPVAFHDPGGTLYFSTNFKIFFEVYL